MGRYRDGQIVHFKLIKILHRNKKCFSPFLFANDHYKHGKIVFSLNLKICATVITLDHYTTIRWDCAVIFSRKFSVV